VGQAVLRKTAIHVANLFTGHAGHNRSFDQRTGYQARSMLTVPMIAASGEVIGVVQLINRKRHPKAVLATPADLDAEVIPFDEHAQSLAKALASQAGISLENAQLHEEIQRLFHHFVDAAVTAIESRDPTTSGHSRRVATLTVGLAQTLDGLSQGPFADVHFSREDLRQIEYAGVLHDFGKVGVREQVLVKAKRLYGWQRDLIETRLRYLRAALENQSLRAKLAAIADGQGQEAMVALEGRLAIQLAEIDELWFLVVSTNEPSPLLGPASDRIQLLGRQSYCAEDGQTIPYLRDDELLCLQTPRGTLTTEERAQIQSHVLHTLDFLRTIPWGRALRRVPTIAGSHHELMDGSGYPMGLRGDAIPVETRMLTISDIFDALTASDRPYKSAVPLKTSLGILESEAKAGKVDADLVAIFIGAELWKKVL
jgi:HD-GYP domain-containing protein (c-di-GMP phosphodiesterase class II)